MILTKYITKSCIIPHMSASTKPEALRELTHLLFEKRKLPDVGTALDQIFAREATESTGIGHGIAVPHARITGLKTLMCAVGRAPQGIDFSAIDRQPVELVFLICYPPTEQTAYLNFVATVTRILSHTELRQRIMQAATAEEFYDLLEDASRNFTEKPEQNASQVKAAPEVVRKPDAHTDLVLLARLQLYQEMLVSARTGKSELKQKVDRIRSLIDPRILKHYDRVAKARPPALVSVEGDTCQGCFMRLPSKFVQQVRQESEHIHTCPNCSRYIYVV